MNSTRTLDHLAQAWRAKRGSWQLVVGAALVFAAAVGGALAARIGTGLPRLAGAFAITLALLLVIWVFARDSRDFGNPRRTIRRVLVASEPALGERTLRAIGLAERAEVDPSVGSAELARLHYERLLAQASLTAIGSESARRTRFLRLGSLALLIVGGLGIGREPERVLEGLDVMLARHGRAPFSMPWLQLVRVTAQQPAYLRSTERIVFAGTVSAQPRGSTIIVRGLPVRDGRKLVLTDGKQEVPFVDDAAGGVVAHFSLDRSAELSIAARFGQVLIMEPAAFQLNAVPDEAPVVELEGAPKTLELANLDALELRYAASDDHGLREVDLVLQAGAREERRVLTRLDGETRTERGAHVLSPRDAFLRRMFLPVEVRIEARDNDVLAGVKWGKSEPITLLLPRLGQAERERFAAILSVRRSLTDLLGWQLDAPNAAGARRKEEAERLRAAARELRNALDQNFAGLRITPGLKAFLTGQARVLERPWATPTGSLRRTEAVLLAVDTALRSLGNRDAASVAKRLGDVAEEAADGAREALETERRARGQRRLETALGVLDNGASNLQVLGPLGRDLGELTVGEIARVRRAQTSGSMLHAELAARHLAARLRRPTPSFGSAGRSGGVEAGGPSQKSEEPSDAAQKFDELVAELERLASEHAQGIENVERTLSDAEKAVNLDAFKDAAAEHAARLRDSIAHLPQFSDDPGSARSSAALGREHLAAMAQSLERMALNDSVESGKAGRSQLDDAAKKSKEPTRASDFLDRESLDEARAEAERALAWAEQALDRASKSADVRSRSGLQDSAGREQGFADRAGNLAGRGNHGEIELPGELAEALGKAEGVMRDAARELSAGRGKGALALQREAQRLLEQSNGEKTGQNEESPAPSGSHRDGGDDGNQRMRTDADVPRAGSGSDARDFRRRVVEGLGKDKGGRLSPAVRRYAEGLLK